MRPHPTRPDPSYTEGKGAIGQPGKFCSFCGRPLVESRVLSGYSDRTGEPRYITRRDCPLIVGGLTQ